MRKKKPRTSLTAARKYKSSIKSPWHGPVVDRNRGSKSNSLPSGAAEYGMISRVIGLESILDDAIEFGVRAWMSKLTPSQKMALKDLPPGVLGGAGGAEAIMKSHNYETNKKIATWGGVPPVVAGVASYKAGQKNQKKSEKRIIKAINKKKKK